jgi:hypothetical protein
MLFRRVIIGRNEELNSLTIIEFYQTSNEIGIDELERCPFRKLGSQNASGLREISKSVGVL